jgi:hypothetical protein
LGKLPNFSTKCIIRYTLNESAHVPELSPHPLMNVLDGHPPETLFLLFG